MTYLPENRHKAIQGPIPFIIISLVVPSPYRFFTSLTEKKTISFPSAALSLSLYFTVTGFALDITGTIGIEVQKTKRADLIRTT
jgi:hypothetical protein